MWQVWALPTWGRARSFSPPGRCEPFTADLTASGSFLERFASGSVDWLFQEALWVIPPCGPGVPQEGLGEGGASGPGRPLARGVVPVGAEKESLVPAQGPTCSGEKQGSRAGGHRPIPRGHLVFCVL